MAFFLCDNGKLVFFEKCSNNSLTKARFTCYTKNKEWRKNNAMQKFFGLDRLIGTLEENHRFISDCWAKYSGAPKINLAKKLVIDVVDLKRNPELMTTILQYRAYLFEIVTELSLHLAERGFDSRIKNQNSIENKLQTYTKKKEKGKIPLYKCLNDLYGARFLASGFTIDEVYRHVKESYPHLRVMDATKDEYKAVHVYFQGGNYNFPWELQVWRAEDEQANKESHRKYKQEYTKWEKETTEEV